MKQPKSVLRSFHTLFLYLFLSLSVCLVFWNRYKLKFITGWLHSCCWRAAHSRRHTVLPEGCEIPQRSMSSIYEGSDYKFLARPGRKKATATKLGIYSAYSPRSSIHILARCSYFCQLLKKNSECCLSNQFSAAALTSASEEKWRTFNCLFQSREQAVVRRGQIRRTGWMIKILEAQVVQFLLGCKCPVSRGIVVQEQDRLGDLPAAFFLQNVL